MDNNLERFDQLVVENYLTGYCRHLAFSEKVQGLAWSCDLGKGIIQYDSLGAFPVEMLGTLKKEPVDDSYLSQVGVANRTDEFLWSWANPNHVEWAASVYETALYWKTQADNYPGLAVFNQSTFNPTWVHCLEVAAVCGQFANRPFWIASVGDDVDAIFLVDYPAYDLSWPEWHSLPHLFFTSLHYTYGNHFDIITAFLKQLGYSLEHEGNFMLVKNQKNEVIKLIWTDDGRRLASSEANFNGE